MFIHFIKFTTKVRKLSTLASGVKYDAVIIGGGHNGLVCAAYLAKAGKRVCVLERRHLVGGAAVTEEIVPGFKFSRASYVLGLLRPRIMKELELERHGLHVLLRSPSSYTPLHESWWETNMGKGGHSLTLGPDAASNHAQLKQFSAKDAEVFSEYEKFLNKCAMAISPLLDARAPDISTHLGTEAGRESGRQTGGGFMGALKLVSEMKPLLEAGRILGGDVPRFLELLTAPASRILGNWFTSEPLIATLATDSVIGAMLTPHTPGSGYVLLHHVMASAGGVAGAWGYPVGGMGAVSEAIARSARAAGAEIYTNQPVKSILVSSSGEAEGVETEDGLQVRAAAVLSNATPHTTFLILLPPGILPPRYEQSVRAQDYTSPVCKINVALNRLPDFSADKNPSPGVPQPHHRCTIHLHCEDSSLIDHAFQDCSEGRVPDKPLIEMTLPSSLDDSLAPAGCHVALMFTQYVPYAPAPDGWTPAAKEAYAKQIFEAVDGYAPGFSNSIVGYEVLPPPDLEEIFGLTGGNIFHGAMSLDRLYWSRPSPDGPAPPATPVPRLFLCGAGAHPGGGVMGAPGRLAALALLGRSA